MSYFTPDVIAREQLQGVQALQPPSAAEEVGIYPPRPRLRRIRLALFAVATSSFAITQHTLTVQLLADLLEQLLYESLILSELACKKHTYIQLRGQVTRKVTINGLAYAEYVRKLTETVRLTGVIDPWETLLLLKLMEDM